jgi:hypothetical protein
MTDGGIICNRRPSADSVRFYYVYILICSDGKPYTGCTDDLKVRIDRDNKGQVPAIKEDFQSNSFPISPFPINTLRMVSKNTLNPDQAEHF